MDLLAKNSLIQSLTWVNEVVQRVHVIDRLSSCMAEFICGLFGSRIWIPIWYYLLSITHALEYLHKQQYLIGLARTHYYKYNALLKIYLMYVLQCPNEWGAYYALMNVGYAHTI